MEERQERVPQDKGTGVKILEGFRRWLLLSNLFSPSMRTEKYNAKNYPGPKTQCNWKDHVI